MSEEMYILRVRQPDGSWEWEMDNPMPKRTAKKQAQFARALGGILCQVWSEEEAREAQTSQTTKAGQ